MIFQAYVIPGWNASIFLVISRSSAVIDKVRAIDYWPKMFRRARTYVSRDDETIVGRWLSQQLNGRFQRDTRMNKFDFLIIFQCRIL